MKVTSYAVARPNYYDRDTTSYADSYDGATVAPHTYTVRSTTTVASGKKLLIESMFTYMRRKTAATAVSDYLIAATTYTSTSNASLSRLFSISNTLGVVQVTQTSQFTMFPAEYYEIVTADFSTGGTVEYLCGVKGVTFDA